MSFPAYEEYREVGIPWLDEVPAHWVVTRIDHVTDFINGKAHEPFVDEDGDFICVNSRFISTDGVALKMCTENITPAQFDDVLMVMSDLPNGRALARTYHVQDGRDYAINQRVCAIRSISPTPRFLFYLLNRNPWFLRNDDGLNQTHLPSAAFQKMPLFLPPPAEQTAIASFLDTETSKIDSLVSEQRRLIELLKEKRQAVISHAVTKGLDPSVPMKDSGIEWLGDVPEGWGMKRLKHVSPFISVGIVVNPSSYISEDVNDLPFIYGGDIREGVIDWTNSRRIHSDASATQEKTRLEADDLLVVRVGAPGVTAVVPKECVGGNCASVMLMRKGEFNSQWLCYVMNTRVVRFQVEIVEYGAAQKQFNIAHAVNFWVPVPDRNEQDEIVAALEKQVGEFNELVAQAERAIELLQERRTALISAAVTGKIDVREFVCEVVA